MEDTRPLKNRATQTKRSKVQIWIDILRSIHFSGKGGNPPIHYRLERDVGLTSKRLKRFLRELQGAKLLGEGLTITDRGYTFLSEMTGRVIPALEKYGLWQTGT